MAFRASAARHPGKSQPEPQSAAQAKSPSRNISAKPSSLAPAVAQGLNSPAETLDPKTRAKMEPRFGLDFSQVRLHRDVSADESARRMGALAYTLGNHVVFARGQYDPTSARGEWILAHELSHVAQNAAAPRDPFMTDDSIRMGHSSDRFEHEAGMAARHIQTGGQLGTTMPMLSTVATHGAQIQCLRPDEMVDPTNENAGDKFAAQTTQVALGTVDYTLNGIQVSVPKEVGVFVPSGLGMVNRVHLFFTPYVSGSKGQAMSGAALSYAEEQGLRSQSEVSQWILIAVPAMEEGGVSFVSMSTSEIQKCLTTVGRPNPSEIEAIRLSAHSRGYRGLAHTMGWKSGGAAKIDLSKVDRVSVFDASYQDLGNTLKTHIKDLPQLQDRSDATKFDPDAVRLYDVTVNNVSGLQGIDLKDPLAVQGLAYIRFAQDHIDRGMLDISEFAPPGPSQTPVNPPVDIRAATTRLLGKMPPRGLFVTKHPNNFLSWSPGVQDIQKFIADNRQDLRLIAREKDGLKAFLLGLGLSAGGQPWGNDAHHWLATELSHETTE